ncbi:MAG: tetratricopeptide repeat protein [Spirochaetales bacterium]
MKHLHKEATAESPERRPATVVMNFLARHRTTMLVAIAVIAVAVVALIVVLTVQSNRNEAALTTVEDLQDEFDDWLALEDAEQPEAYDALSAELEQLIDDYPRTYAAARARIIDARALAQLERWQEASDRYVEVADLFPETYLAPVSLMDAAVAAEEAGNADGALELHRRIVHDYAEQSAEVPRALFSIGRILEGTDNVAEAAEAYRTLVDDYPASSWTNLARNRIITLTVEGRIGE